jgi:hypothetical protein
MKTAGVSVSALQRIWRAHGLQLHRVWQFKLSQDPKFVDKLRDIVGLYVDPPAHAVILPVDEKSQIQALDRTHPSLQLHHDRAECVQLMTLEAFLPRSTPRTATSIPIGPPEQPTTL